VPAQHFEQDDAPADAAYPAAQDTQAAMELAPVEEEAVPAAHAVHAAEPSDSE